ncbi:hypothetical protein A2974_00845 [Candidatus Peregrinibacteria bacterium RIFCSPLOWO2_01_FULL_48_20]|nr:MAG: hypothetical protein A2974_00845 [Candidatus Peregrinibacteria bacterium RIFCSPLOWO2_01_FULL_48_20]
MIKKCLIFMLGLMLGLSLFGGLLSFVPPVQADDEKEVVNPVVQPTIPVPDFLPAPDVGSTGGETQNFILNETIPRAINIGIGILSITAFIGILISAIQMLTAYGNDEKLNRAKTNLRYSLIGLVLVMLSYAIVSIVVSIALPNEEDAESWLIPSAYAVDDEDVEILLPNQQKLIEEQDDQGRVSLPGGDFLGEVVPAIITNLMYVVAFLIFIAFMYGGVLLVIGRGQEESLTKAKNIMIYAAIALALVSLGFALVYGITTLNLTEDEESPSDDVFVDTEERNE